MWNGAQWDVDWSLRKLWAQWAFIFAVDCLGDLMRAKEHWLTLLGRERRHGRLAVSCLPAAGFPVWLWAIGSAFSFFKTMESEVTMAFSLVAFDCWGLALQYPLSMLQWWQKTQLTWPSAWSLTTGDGWLEGHHGSRLSMTETASVMWDCYLGITLPI